MAKGKQALELLYPCPANLGNRGAPCSGVIGEPCAVHHQKMLKGKMICAWHQGTMKRQSAIDSWRAPHTSFAEYLAAGVSLAASSRNYWELEQSWRVLKAHFIEDFPKQITDALKKASRTAEAFEETVSDIENVIELGALQDACIGKPDFRKIAVLRECSLWGEYEAREHHADPLAAAQSWSFFYWLTYMRYSRVEEFSPWLPEACEILRELAPAMVTDALIDFLDEDAEKCFTSKQFVRLSRLDVKQILDQLG